MAAANGHPDLTEVAVSDPWHVFEVSDSPVVEVLTHEPVVATGVDGSQHGWMPVAVAWMLGDDVRDVHLAADGPSHWERVEIEPVPEDSSVSCGGSEIRWGSRAPWIRCQSCHEPHCPMSTCPRSS